MVIKLAFPFVKHNPKEGMDEEKNALIVFNQNKVQESFEAKMKSFLRDSNERLHDLKPYQLPKGKRGGRGRPSRLIVRDGIPPSLYLCIEY